MSQWITRIKDHGIWKALRDLGEEIDKAERRDQILPEAFDGLERLRSVLTFVGKRLASIDPAHAAPGPLDGMAPRLQTALENLVAFSSDGDPSRIIAANNHADSAMAILATLPGPETSDDLTALSESAASYRTALEQYTNKFVSSAIANQTSLDTLAARVGELDKRVSAEGERLTKVIADQQAEFAATQAARGKAFDDVESARRQAFDKATTENKDAFKEEQKRLTEAVEKLSAEYSEQLAAHKTQLADQSAKAADLNKTELENLRVQFAKSAKSILDEIEAHKAQVEKLVGVIGNLGVTSGYLKAANYARTSHVVWQSITVLSLLGLVGAALFAFIPIVGGAQIGWEGFASRVFITLTVGVLAAYAGSQADKHLQIEKRNRTLALEFEALGPFLAPLPSTEQDTFRIKVGDRSFGRSDGDDHGRSPVTLVDLVAELEKSSRFKELLVGLVERVAPRKG